MIICDRRFSRSKSQFLCHPRTVIDPKSLHMGHTEKDSGFQYSITHLGVWNDFFYEEMDNEFLSKTKRRNFSRTDDDDDENFEKSLKK
jgi:hypothetical protein